MNDEPFFWPSFAIAMVLIWLALFFRARRTAMYAVPGDYDLLDRPKLQVRFSGFRRVRDDIVWNSIAFVFRIKGKNGEYEVSATLSRSTIVKRIGGEQPSGDPLCGP